MVFLDVLEMLAFMNGLHLLVRRRLITALQLIGRMPNIRTTYARRNIQADVRIMSIVPLAILAAWIEQRMQTLARLLTWAALLIVDVRSHLAGSGRRSKWMEILALDVADGGPLSILVIFFIDHVGVAS